VPPRRPGQHARETARRHARHVIVALIVLVAVAFAAALATDFSFSVALVVEAAVPGRHALDQPTRGAGR
jgi:hypothetical protein